MTDTTTWTAQDTAEWAALQAKQTAAIRAALVPVAAALGTPDSIAATIAAAQTARDAIAALPAAPATDHSSVAARLDRIITLLTVDAQALITQAGDGV